MGWDGVRRVLIASWAASAMLVVWEGRREKPSTGRPWAAGEILLGSGHPGWRSVQALERGETRPRERRSLVALAHTAHCAFLFWLNLEAPSQMSCFPPAILVKHTSSIFKGDQCYLKITYLLLSKLILTCNDYTVRVKKT